TASGSHRLPPLCSYGPGMPRDGRTRNLDQPAAGVKVSCKAWLMSPLGQAFCVPRFVQRIWLAEPNASGGPRERQSFRYEAVVPDPVGRLQFTLPAQIAATVSMAER